MKKRLKIEEMLCCALDQAPEPDFEKLAETPVVRMTEHDYITRQEQKPQKASWQKRYFRPPFSSAIAGIMIMLTMVSANWYAVQNTPTSIIALDADHSVEIVTNKQNQIIRIKTYDEAVQGALNEKNFKKSSLEDCVGEIVTAMIQNGYLDGNKGVVMLTVENSDKNQANGLAVALNRVIKQSATAENVKTTVIKQTVTPDQRNVAMTEQYNVSAGKLNVMKEIAVADVTMSMGRLANLSMSALLEVSKEKEVDLTEVVQVDSGDKTTNSAAAPADEDVPPPAVSGDVVANEVTVPPVVAEPSDADSTGTGDSGETEPSLDVEVPGDSKSLNAVASPEERSDSDGGD